jgi:hypothetical protein
MSSSPLCFFRKNRLFYPSVIPLSTLSLTGVDSLIVRMYVCSIEYGFVHTHIPLFSFSFSLYPVLFPSTLTSKYASSENRKRKGISQKTLLKRKRKGIKTEPMMA